MDKKGTKKTKHKYILIASVYVVIIAVAIAAFTYLIQNEVERSRELVIDEPVVTIEFTDKDGDELFSSRQVIIETETNFYTVGRLDLHYKQTEKASHYTKNRNGTHTLYINIDDVKDVAKQHIDVYGTTIDFDE